VESIKQEIQTIIDEIDSLKGLAGRPREIGSTTEKARISVKKCIDKAYEHMSKHSSELEQYFRTHINTGTTCSYNLDSLSPINWAL